MIRPLVVLLGASLVSACSSAPATFKQVNGRPLCDGAKGYASALDGRRTYLWRGDQLSELKQAYAREPSEFRALFEAAEAALSHSRYSVVDKPNRPAHVGPHDYVSLATYWWPHPGTEDNLPYMRRDGVENPARNGAEYDLSRLTAFSSDVQTLAFAYYLSGDSRYASKAAELVRAWFLDAETSMSPHLRYAQMIPGRTPGRGTGIIDTSRLIGVVEAIGLISTPEGLTQGDLKALHAWFAKYIDWMLSSENGKKERAATNNHGSWFDAQMLSFGLFSGRVDLAREVAQAAAKKRIAAQIEPNGEMPLELDRARTFFYSLYGTQALMDLATFAECTGVDLWHYKARRAGGIQDSVDLLASFAGREQSWPHAELRVGGDHPLFHDVLIRGSYVYTSKYLKDKDDVVSKTVNRSPALLIPPINRLPALQESTSDKASD